MSALSDLLRDHMAKMREVIAKDAEKTGRLAQLNELLIFRGAFGKDLRQVDPAIAELLNGILSDEPITGGGEVEPNVEVPETSG